MRFDWRASAIAAGAAFILSFLVGILGGVSFGALVLRAVLSALAFGAGAVVVSLIVDRYLPDLKQSLTAPKTDAEAKPGSRVDIVVDDESTGFVGEADGFELAETDEPGTVVADDDAEAEPLDAEDPGDEVEGSLEPAEEEAESESGFTPGIAAERVESPAQPGEAAAAGDELEELEEADADDDGSDADGPDADAATGDASAGNLPDIEGMSGSFADAPGALDEVDGSGDSGEDPSMMARAIRTVLKREE
jgi:hypothetical protein